MAIEAKKKTIDGIEVIATQFAGRRGFTLKAKLIKLVGPSLFSLFKSLPGDKQLSLETDIDLSNIGEGLEMLVSKLSEHEWLKLVEELLEGTTLDGQDALQVFDSVFSAKYSTLYKIIGFILEVNYGSFLGQNGIGALTEKLKSKTLSKKR